MRSLSGNLIRIEDDILRITLNEKLTGNLYYLNKMDGKLNFLLDFENANIIEFKDPNKDNRNFYVLKGEEKEELILAERLVPFKKFCNFRDLGGYETRDGRKVKWGVFYRSETLHKLKGNDLKYFKTLGIKYIFDYRSNEEVKLNPDVQVEGVNYVGISAMKNLDNQNLDMESYLKSFFKEGVGKSPEEILMDGYYEMPLDNEALKKLMETIENPNNTPILQHCTSGKDRTGLGSALILLLLGVPEDKVIEDYMLSNEYRKGSTNKVLKMYENHIANGRMKKIIEDLLSVKKSYIKLSLNRIKDSYGSYEKYFLGEYNLNKERIEKIRNEYLY